MEKLKEKSILIGRDPNASKLLISVNVNGQIKSASIGDNVPNSVSRCVPNQDSAHCKIAINQNGDMILTNLKEQNITKVNGDEILSKRITNASRISLGREDYTFSVETVLEAARKLIPNPPAVPKSIKHLEKVYQDYEKAIENIALKKEKQAKKASLPMIITMTGTSITAIIGFIPKLRIGAFITLPCTLVALFLHFKKYTHKDTSREETKKLQHELINNYVCPHCQHYLGAQPYMVIKQNKKCPYCKGDWIS